MNFRTSTLLAATFFSLISASACGSSSDGPSPVAGSAGVSIEEIAKQICDGAPERMGSDAELFTKTSWMCTFGDDQVRIDEFKDGKQMEAARAMVLEIYTSNDSTATLSDYPFVCGDLWVAGFDYNVTRDAAITLLNSMGVEATLC